MPIIPTMDEFNQNMKAQKKLINDNDFGFVKQIDWLDYTSVYQMLNFVKPLCLSMLDEIRRLKEELTVVQDASFAKQMALDEMYKYYKFDKSAYEDDSIEKGTHIRACSGDLLKIK